MTSETAVNGIAKRSASLTAGARETIGAWRGRGTLIVVSHGANILPLTRIHPGEGEIVVVEPDPASPDRLKVLGRIAPGP